MLTVACWNVLADVHALPSRYAGVPRALLEGNHRRRSVARLVEELAHGADIVALQEVDESLVRVLRQAQLEVRHLVRPSVPEGVALVSRKRWPVEVETGGSRDRRRVWLGVLVDGCAVVSVHLDWTDPARKSSRSLEQAVDLVTWLDQRFADQPTVIAGDINAPWNSEAGRILAEHGFVPLCGGSATAAVNGSACELDVIATRNCTGRAAIWKELPGVGDPIWLPTTDVPSDHVPLIATVSLRTS